MTWTAGVPSGADPKRPLSRRRLMGVGALAARAFLLCLLFSAIGSATASAQDLATERSPAATERRPLVAPPYRSDGRSVALAPPGVSKKYVPGGRRLAVIRSLFGGDSYARSRSELPREAFGHDGVRTVAGWQPR